MLSVQFIEQNIHFAISLFTALVFFAVFWLYFDAWTAGTKHVRDLLKWIGFFLASVSFVIYATLIEQTNLGHSIFGGGSALVADALRLLAYIIIIVGQILDPLQKKPKTNGLDDVLDESAPETPARKIIEPAQAVQAAPAQAAASIAAAVATPPQPAAAAPQPRKIQVSSIFAITAGNGYGTVFALPLGACIVALLYWRRATTGIERHLKPVAFAFLLFFAFELFSLGELFRDTNDPTVFNLVKPFGPVWITSHVFLLLGALALGRWVWRYLTERFMSQLFMLFTSAILAVFLITTVSFTFLLLRSIQSDALDNLETASSVLSYALNSKEAETRADAESVASNPAVVDAITTKNHAALNTLTSDFLESRKQASLIVTTNDAQVLLRAEEPDRWGDSISSDTLVRRALIGEDSSTVATQSGVLAPVVTIRSIVPVRDDSGTIIGTVSSAIIVDNAFVDGIKHATGLDSAVYSGNVRSATTLTAPDGISRWVGVKETNHDVQDTVLKHGAVFKGSLDVLNRQYLAVYAPLKDADNTVIGMLFIGQPEVAILQTATYLIGLTFIVAVILLAAAIIPAYWIARHITKQLE